MTSIPPSMHDPWMHGGSSVGLGTEHECKHAFMGLSLAQQQTYGSNKVPLLYKYVVYLHLSFRRAKKEIRIRGEKIILFS